MSIPSLEEVMAAGQQRGWAPEARASGIRIWQEDMIKLGRERYAGNDPDTYWNVVRGVGEDVNAALTGLGALAGEREAARLFPDPAERAQFRSVVASSSGDPDKMDAPPAWQEAARRVADASALPVFRPGGVQYGTIAQGPNPLAVYEVRTKPEGGYEAYVQPQGEDGKPGKGVIVPLSGDRAAFTADAEGRKAKADFDYEMSIPDAESMGFGGVGGGAAFGDVMDTMNRRVENADARLHLATKGSLSQVLHVQLDDQLRTNKAFLDQLPQHWGEQLVTRPLAGVARSLGQGTAAVTSLGADSLTQDGQDAVEVQTPGALSSRYAAGEDMPVSDMISQGIESLAIFAGPALLARGGAAALGAAGRAAAAAGQVAEVGSNAAWGTMYATSFGANFAGAIREAEGLQATDPAKADRIRSLSYWTSLMNAGIEMASERIFPDEAHLLAGRRLPWKSIATMPLKESAEEFTGALAQNAVAGVSGQAAQDPLQAGEGGFWGGLPFMGGHAALRGMPSRSIPAPGPLASGPGPDSSLFPGGRAPDFEAAPAGLDSRTVGATPALAQPPAFDPLPPDSGAGAGGPLVGAPPPASAVASPGELADAGGVAQAPPLTPATEQDPTGTVPETPETLAEQRRRVLSGQRDAMLFPGLTADQVPRNYLPGQDEGLILTETPAGTFLHPYDISSAEIGQAVADGRTGQLLGMGTDAKPQDATDALVQRTADGTEVTAAAVTPDTFDATLAALRSSASPDDTVSLETPEEVLARRVDPAAAPAVSGFPASDEAGKVNMPPPPATPENVEGEPINQRWTAFAPESGTLGIPRAEMPQIKAEHRGALVNFLNARGVTHERQEVRPDALKPTQAEYSPGKVGKARSYEGTPRAILVSSDNHVVDGHHQWVAALDNPAQPIPVMRLDAPIRDLIPLVNEFPSSEQSGGGTPKAAATSPRATLPKGVRRFGSLPERLLPEYFAPGNIVPGYGGMDRVLEYVPQGEGEPVWRVRVQRQIREADGTFRDDPNVSERWHSTHPTNGDAVDAGFLLDPQKSAAENWADRALAEGRGRLYTGIDPTLLAAYAVKGSYLIARGVRDFAAWSAEMLREFGEAVRPYLQRAWAQSTGMEEPALLPGGAVPPVPAGPVNAFGQRVDADGRLRGAWRANFRPAEYSPFTEEQLSRDIRAWIGREGGLEGAARLFLDPESGLLDYERNALGQQLAIGLDQRARRSERTGNAAATAVAEAMLDTVIQRLEQYATQAGQALRAFGMWSRFSPRGIVRAVQRRTAAARETHVKETLDTTPDEVIDAVNQEETRAEVEEKEERKKRGDGAAQRWIERLARSQSDTLSWGSPAALSELEKLIRAHMETVNPSFARQAEALGVPTHEADVLDRLVIEEHRRSATIAREKALERLVQKLTQPKTPRGVKAKIPPLVQALLDAKAAGVLDRSAFLDAYSQAFNMPRFTPEFAAQVRGLAERAENTPQGSWLRQMAQQALMTRLALWEGIPTRDVLTAFWYANILSGIGTQLVNISGNATHLLMKTAQVALTNSPARSIQFVRGMLKGAAEGVRQGREAFVNGWPVMKGETEWQRQSVLEMMWQDDPSTIRGLIAKYGAASWGRYVFRALTAADSLFYNTAKEGRAWLEASRALDRGETLQEALGFDAASWSAAQTMAHADLQQAGTTTPTTRQVDRRAFEIVEGKRRAEVIATARRFGAEATFNYDPEGTMGAFAEVAGLLVKRVPPMRAIIPFVNIVANVADQSMDWTPVGVVRGMLGRHIFNSQDQRFTGRQRVEKIVSGTIATLGAAALYALAKMNEDKDDLIVPFMIYGMGPTDKNRRAQMPRGWKPFSVKIGDTYISYAETPLGILLSTVGTAMDRRRYTGKKNSDEVMERGFALLTGAGQSLMRTGVLSSMDKLFGMIDGSAKPGQVAYRTAAGLIPAQAFLRSLAEAMDPTKVDTSTFTGTLLSNLPIARSYGQPVLNIFGENVREPGPWLISRLATRQDRTDAEATWLAAKGLHIPGISDELAVADYLPSNRGESVRIARQNGRSPLEADRLSRAGDLERLASGYLTPEERTKLIRLSGPRIRNAVRQLQRELATGSYQPKNPAAIQRRLSEKVTAARQLSRLEMVK